MSTTVRSHKAAAEALRRGFSFSYKGLTGTPVGVVASLGGLDPLDRFTQDVLKHHNLRKDRYLALGTREPLANAPLYVVTKGDKIVLAVVRYGAVRYSPALEEGRRRATVDAYVQAGAELGYAYSKRTDWI